MIVFNTSAYYDNLLENFNFFNIPQMLLNLIQVNSLAIVIESDIKNDEFGPFLNKNNDIENITDLIVKSTNITQISEEMFNFKYLRNINLSMCPVDSFPDKFFTSFENLESLCLTISPDFKNSIEEILKNLRKMKKLKTLELKIFKDSFIKFNKQIVASLEKITNLEELKFYCDFQSMQPNDFSLFLENFPNIKKVGICSDKFCKKGNFFGIILEKLANLEEITGFYRMELNSNCSWRKNESIRKILFEENRLTEIPEKLFESLPNLKSLEVSLNSIQCLPNYSPENLKKLKELKISKNKLDETHSNFCNFFLKKEVIKKCVEIFPSLEKLDLSDSRLELPNAFDQISPNLKWINFQNTFLEYLPSSFKEASKQIQLLDLRNNPGFILTKIGYTPEDMPENALCAEDLHNIYRNRALLPKIFKKSIRSVENKLKRQNLIWNFSYIRNARNKPIPKGKMNRKELLGILYDGDWIENNDKKELGDLIDQLFDKLENKEINICCDGYLARRTLDIIEAILKIKSDLKSDSTADKSTRNINVMISKEKFKNSISTFIQNSKETCIDGKREELATIYSILTGNVNPDLSLENFIFDFISKEKEFCFQIIAAPPFISESVEIYLNWKYKLRDDLGFEIDKPHFGMYNDEDPYNDSHGNILDAFYHVFTPEHAIDKLYEILQEDRFNLIKYELLSIIADSIEDGNEDCVLTKEGIKYYLKAKSIIFECYDSAINEDTKSYNERKRKIENNRLIYAQ